MSGNLMVDKFLEWLLQNASGPAITLLVIIFIGRWARPRIEALIDAHIMLVNTVNTSWKRTNEMLPVLTHFVRETRRRLLYSRTTVLIVEDSVQERFALEKLLQPIAKKYALSIISVGSLHDAIPLLVQSCVAIIDIELEDSNFPETTRMFISLVSIPVIIYTSHADLAGMVGIDVVSKNDPEAATKLAELIEHKLKNEGYNQ